MITVNPKWRHFMSTTTGSCVIFLFCIGIFSQCHAPDQELSHRKDLNIILIAVDTLCAKHIGCYNDEISFTPNIDKLAKNGVRFSRAYSTSSWTQPAVASLFTSLTNQNHGLQKIGGVLSSKFETLAEILQTKGYKTAGIISSPILGEKYGFSQGFDFFLQVNNKSLFETGKSITSHKVSDQAIAWLEKTYQQFGHSPFFLFLHYFDPHWLYRNHSEFYVDIDYKGKLTPETGMLQLLEKLPELTQDDIAYLISLYNAEIAYTDHYIGRLLAFLEKSKLVENTLIILTADHGEEFMQHNYIGHVQSLYEELIHVPLIFYTPEVFPPHTVDAPVSILDIIPTIFGLSSKPTDRSEWEGISLLPYLFNNYTPEEHRDVFSSVSFDTPLDSIETKGNALKTALANIISKLKNIKNIKKNAHKTALINKSFKLIHDKPTDTWELYNLADDPMEQKNLAQIMPDMLSTMTSKIRKFENRQTEKDNNNTRKHPVLSADEIEQLKSLGYIR